MVFSSAIFLFFFLPLTFLADRLLPAIRAKNTALILASLIFYAFGEPVYMGIMLVSVAANYFMGRIAAKEGIAGKTGVCLAVVINLLMLGVFKYADFLVETINSLLGCCITQPGIRLPIGISFFTFQAMSYVIDVYRNKELYEKSFSKVLLYISFFPQLVAGPIVKYTDIREELSQRRTVPEESSQGLRRFITGLAKKLLIANTLGQVADTVYYLAKKCGYSPTTYSGQVHYRNGNTGRHGWTEITISGTRYIFDPEMDWSYTHRVGSHYNGWKRKVGTTEMTYIKP